MAALLNDPHLACYARFGMEPNPDPSVDEAFRAALPKLTGKLQIGVINSIGVRKDAKAVDALKKLLDQSDPEVAQAAAASLGMIGGLQAAQALQAALGRTKVPVFPVVARATLLCAEGLMATRSRTRARVVPGADRDNDAEAGAVGRAAGVERGGSRTGVFESMAGADRRSGSEGQERVPGQVRPGTVGATGVQRTSTAAERLQMRMHVDECAKSRSFPAKNAEASRERQRALRTQRATT